jgi:hypothetical protein
MLVLRYQEKMKMRKQRQRTAWGTGMNPTGRYAQMFEGENQFIQTTTEILIKKK